MKAINWFLPEGKKIDENIVNYLKDAYGDYNCIAEQIVNYYIANSQMEIYKKVIHESGFYDYYGIDGTGDYCARLLIATLYSNEELFYDCMKEFGYAGDNSSSDNLYIINNDLIPTERRHTGNVVYSYETELFSNIPPDKLPGNVIDCDFLIHLASYNPHNILKMLRPLKNHYLFTTYWYDEDERYTGVTKLVGDNVPIIMAINKTNIYKNSNPESYYDLSDIIVTINKHDIYIPPDLLLTATKLQIDTTVIYILS